MANIKKNEELSPELYDVARCGGMEAPFTGKYWNTHDKGMYKCAVCGNELFSSDTKFDSGTGWPSFTEPANRENVELVLPILPPSEQQNRGSSISQPNHNDLGEIGTDTSHGMNRTEVKCKKCGAHLGHVFDDGPSDKGGKRYCINSVSLEMEKEE